MYKSRTRPPRYDTAEEFNAVGERYFAQCELLEERPTIVGLALYLGYASKQTMYDLRSGKCDDGIGKELSYPATRLMARCESHLCTEAKPEFLLKNHFGYVEKQEVEHQGGIKVIPMDDKDLKA